MQGKKSDLILPASTRRAYLRHAGVLSDTMKKLGGKPVKARMANDYGFPVEQAAMLAELNG